jgi:hypothetical protein
MARQMGKADPPPPEAFSGECAHAKTAKLPKPPEPEVLAQLAQLASGHSGENDAAAAGAAWATEAAARGLDGHDPQAEAERPGWRPDSDEQLAGRRQGALTRPPSWWRPERHRPPAGAGCVCCRLGRWWSRDGGQGWACAVCHPAPAELAGVMQCRTEPTNRQEEQP